MPYTNKVIEHFRNPHNQGSIPGADAVGEVGNPVCGDVMKIYLKISKRPGPDGRPDDFIEDIKFETLGCAAAIAVSSALTDLAKGKTLSEAARITKDRIVEDLGGLPAAKVHCSMLGVDALRQAVDKYNEKITK